MKNLLFSTLIAGTILTSGTSYATTIADWTFEINTPADLTDSATISGIAADIGTGTASGVHASAASDWTTPSGNGSANSLSVNTWGVGDYFQFQVSTVGFTSINLTWDQMGSNTGPKSFKLAYSTNGTSFTDFSTYNVINGAWSAGTPVLTTSFTADFTGITGLENASTVYFRFIDTSTTSINGGTVATGGTGRVDNVLVSGTIAAVPEPHEYGIAFGALLGAVILMRRRKAAMMA